MGICPFEITCFQLATLYLIVKKLYTELPSEPVMPWSDAFAPKDARNPYKIQVNTDICFKASFKPCKSIRGLMKLCTVMYNHCT